MRWWIVVATAALGLGCATLRPEPGDDEAVERLPVLLVLDGDPLSKRDATRVADALSHQIRRPIRVTRETGVDRDALTRELRARHGRVPTGPWTSDRCALGEVAAHALAHDAHAHYRVVLRIRERRVDGELIATTFGREPGSRRLPIRAEGRSLDVAKVVAGAVAALESPAYPHWDALARQLLARGCPLAALAVYDARLRHRPASRDVLRAALRSGHAPAAPVAAAPQPAPATPATERQARVSCKALCELHMVELCNNDRELWSQHRAAWETTPCGQMRLEPFLRECYQRQWLTGTFEDACVAPCERTDDGRARLLHLLRGEGCVRTPSS